MTAVPATVETAAETETAFGGRAPAWSPAGLVWVELAPDPPREAGGGDRPPERTQAATARARAHPALAPGVRLLAGDGPPWTVRALRPDDPAPGRVVLSLDRLL